MELTDINLLVFLKSPIHIFFTMQLLLEGKPLVVHYTVVSFKFMTVLDSPLSHIVYIPVKLWRFYVVDESTSISAEYRWDILLPLPAEETGQVSSWK